MSSLTTADCGRAVDFARWRRTRSMVVVDALVTCLPAGYQDGTDGSVGWGGWSEWSAGVVTSVCWCHRSAAFFSPRARWLEVEAVRGGGLAGACGVLPPESGAVVGIGELQDSGDDHGAAGLGQLLSDELGDVVGGGAGDKRFAQGPQVFRGSGGGAVLHRGTVRSRTGRARERISSKRVMRSSLRPRAAGR